MRTVLLFLSLVCAVYGWSFLSNCCEPHDDLHLGWICDDGLRAPVIGCCGKGSCNVMCCNCDGGCKTGNRKPQKFLGVWSAELSPNLGFSGGSNPPAAAVDLLKIAAVQSGIPAAKLGWAANKEQKKYSDIQYIPQGWPGK